jgi:hypothetical protein
MPMLSLASNVYQLPSAVYSMITDPSLPKVVAINLFFSERF